MCFLNPLAIDLLIIGATTHRKTGKSVVKSILIDATSNMGFVRSNELNSSISTIMLFDFALGPKRREVLINSLRKPN